MSQAHRPAGDRHHVVVIGSGFGGLNTDQGLASSDVDITLLDRTNRHLFQPMLYQVATGLVSAGEIAPSTRQLLRKQNNVDVVRGEVTGIDVEKQTVTASQGDISKDFAYDSLVIAAGSNQGYFGNNHFAQYAPGMKNIDDALEIRSRLLGAFERAELTDDPEERARLLTFVIIGAGPTGVELAGQLAELAKRGLKDTFKNISPESAKIILLDGAPQVLPPFGKKLGKKAQRTLEKQGIEVRLNAMVSDVDEDKVVYKNMTDDSVHTIESPTKIWSAGVEASPLGKMVAEQANVEFDRAGRVSVNEDMTVGDLDNVYIIGDMMSLNRLPGVAQVAIQSGKHVAKLIDAKTSEDSEQDPKEAFDYFDKGSMAIINRGNAVVKMENSEITGFVGWLMWLVVHAQFLTGVRNRLFTVLNWTSNVVSRNRGNLEITEQQRHGRNALMKLGKATTDDAEQPVEVKDCRRFQG